MEKTVRRALAQHHGDIVLTTLNDLCEKDPKNPIALEEFYAVSLVADGIDGLPHVGFNSSNNASAIEDLGLMRLKQAYQIDSHPWIGLVAQGTQWVELPDVQSFIPGASRAAGIKLLEKAVQLAPTCSVPHFALGDAYCDKANDQWSTDMDAYMKQGHKFDPNFMPDDVINTNRKAAAELEKSHDLDPTYINPTILLFAVYHNSLKDDIAARKWKKIALSLVPSIRMLHYDEQKLLNSVN
jgi:hypothetical protein